MSGKQKQNLIRIIISVVLYIAALALPIKDSLRFAAFLVPYAVIGYDVLWSAVRNIIRGRVFDENFLMALATAGAYAIKEYPEAVAVMLFYQVGELFQSIAVGKSRKSISSLMDIRPESAVVIRSGDETEIPPEEVAVGEIIIVRPGEKIPLDGVIIEGSTTVNTSALTGEPLPYDKTVSDGVISGTVNLSGVIRVKVESEYENSTVAKILELVENSAAKKAKTERFITRFAKYYTPLRRYSGGASGGHTAAVFFTELWRMAQPRVGIFSRFLPLRSCHIRSALIFRRNRRSLPQRNPH
jgi:ATPase, P-type (transporting), HAD superfamily, subfamily IC